MQGKKKWLVLRGVVIGLACLAGLVCVSWGVLYVRVERAIAQFERESAQMHADDLVGLLVDHAATAKQGARILALVNRPTITTRSRYASGRPVSIALDRPARLDFSQVRWEKEYVWIDGERAHSGKGRGSDKPLCVVVLGAERASLGTHQFKVRCKYSLTVERTSKVEEYLRELARTVRLPVAATRPRIRTYVCDLEIPGEVTVVAPEEAETVELVSSPQFDDAMWETFRVRASRFGVGSNTGPVPLRFDSLKGLCYEDLPIDMAFQATLRVSDDRRLVRYTGVPRPLRGRAGSSGTFSLDPWLMSIDTPGIYRGTLLLTADPNVGYEDPAIKRIWGGELEFPVAFTVSEQ